MNSKTRAHSPLVAAALAFDEELTRFAQAVDGAQRRTLDSQKTLQVVSDLMQEAADSEAALGPKAHALLTELTQARDRQQKQSEQVRAVANHLDERLRTYNDLMTRLRDLGNEVGTVTDVARGIMEQKRTGATTEMVSQLQDLEARIAQSATAADELFGAARAAGFDEVVRQAQSFRQTLSAVLNKFNLARRALGLAVTADLVTGQDTEERGTDETAN